jgi:hypothetical protein
MIHFETGAFFSRHSIRHSVAQANHDANFSSYTESMKTQVGRQRQDVMC